MTKRICMCCGKEYEYCPSCSKYKGTAMSAGFDCDVCKEIFNAVSGYNIGVLTLDDVKVVLDKYNIADVSVYKGVVKEVLMKATAPAKTEVKANMDIELKEKKTEKKSIFRGDIQE